MPDPVTRLMIEDAKQNLIPKLKAIVPVDEGFLKRSIQVKPYRGVARRLANDNRVHLAQKFTMLHGSTEYTMVIGSLIDNRGHRDTQPVVYGHILYHTNRLFRLRWDRVMREYKDGFLERMSASLGAQLGLT